MGRVLLVFGIVAVVILVFVLIHDLTLRFGRQPSAQKFHERPIEPDPDPWEIVDDGPGIGSL